MPHTQKRGQKLNPLIQPALICTTPNCDRNLNQDKNPRGGGVSNTNRGLGRASQIDEAELNKEVKKIQEEYSKFWKTKRSDGDCFREKCSEKALLNCILCKNHLATIKKSITFDPKKSIEEQMQVFAERRARERINALKRAVKEVAKGLYETQKPQLQEIVEDFKSKISKGGNIIDLWHDILAQHPQDYQLIAHIRIALFPKFQKYKLTDEEKTILQNYALKPEPEGEDFNTIINMVIKHAIFDFQREFQTQGLNFQMFWDSKYREHPQLAEADRETLYNQLVQLYNIKQTKEDKGLAPDNKTGKHARGSSLDDGINAPLPTRQEPSEAPQLEPRPGSPGAEILFRFANSANQPPRSPSPSDVALMRSST